MTRKKKVEEKVEENTIDDEQALWRKNVQEAINRDAFILITKEGEEGGDLAVSGDDDDIIAMFYALFKSEEFRYHIAMALNDVIEEETEKGNKPIDLKRFES